MERLAMRTIQQVQQKNTKASLQNLSQKIFIYNSPSLQQENISVPHN